MGRPLVFWTRVEKTATCWPWTGLLTKDGYGAMYALGEHGAHRVAWLLTRGPIPTGMQLDHLCRYRRCVNPDHLEPVTARTNILRGFGAGAVHARQTHCANGHEFDEANTYRWRGGGRRCRTCNRASVARRRMALQQQEATR